MASNPSAYFSTYDKTPYEQHPGNCPCTYHQIDGDKLLQDALTAEWKDWGKHRENEKEVWRQPVYCPSNPPLIPITDS
jgi:hypothetical protein